MAEVAGTAVVPPKTVTPPSQAAQAVDPTKTAGAKAVTAPFTISTVQDRERFFKGLFYGAHGAGKTELAASAVDVPHMRDVLMIDAESGDTTIFDSPRIKHPELVYRIPVTKFHTVAQIQQFLVVYCAARDANNIPGMRKLFAQVTATPDNPNGQILENPPRFRTVIIDSLTEVDAYCSYQVLKIDIDEVQKELNDEGGMDVAGWPEFRKNNEMVKMLVRAYRNLPMNVIFCCAQGYTQDERKKFHYAPAITGKLSSQVQGFVDMVGWVVPGQAAADTGIAPRRVYVQPIEVGSGVKFDAKNRRSVYTQAFFDNPNMFSIMRDIGLIPKETQPEE